MKKINVTELLKDCPKGMELDCTMFDDIEFDSIVDNEYLPIRIRLKNPDGKGYNVYNLTKYGCWNSIESAKCVIFPKGKTTWEGFQRPFKDGDILAYNSAVGTTIFIHRNKNGEHTYKSSFYVGLNGRDKLLVYDKYSLIALNGDCDTRLATEEEKAELFKAIKDNGYRWNEETKTLEKLPKFKVVDRVKKIFTRETHVIGHITKSGYVFQDEGGTGFIFGDEHIYELVPNKFDMTTLKPFDKVLVRGDVGQKWTHDFFGFMDKDKAYPFVCVGHYVIQCIPYEGNEHLLGTTDDCDDYYNIWKK